MKVYIFLRLELSAFNAVILQTDAKMMQMVHLNVMIVRFSKVQSNSGILAGSDSSKCNGRLQSTV